jgi:hypothetical protein
VEPYRLCPVAGAGEGSLQDGQVHCDCAWAGVRVCGGGGEEGQGEEEEVRGGGRGDGYMSAIRKQVIEAIQKIIEKQKVEDFLANPRIPEVLSNPAFLVVPTLGSLVTIDVQEFPAQKNLWSITLALLEDLFEIKVSTGRQTYCVLVIISEINQFPEWDSNGDALRLLQRLFDQVIILPVNNEGADSILRQNLSALLDNPQAKEDLFDFWLEETNSRQGNYERISELSFVNKTIQSLRVENDDQEIHFEPIKDKKLFLKQLSLDIPRKTDLYVKQNIRVLNIKEQFIGRLYYFPFELMVLQEKRQCLEGEYLGSSDLSDMSRTDGSLFKVFFGSQGVFRNKEQLRKLAIYSRFISYEIMGENLHLRRDTPNLFLLLANDLWGPEFSPERYLQMLISAGWKPIRPDDLTRENLLTR